MTDLAADKPAVPRPYCPGCEPEADILLEILDVSWCEAHAPVRSGVDDDLAIILGTGLGSAEAGGEDNRRWCDMIHRAATRTARPPRRKRPLPELPQPRSLPN